MWRVARGSYGSLTDIRTSLSGCPFYSQKADIRAAQREVSFGPLADDRVSEKTASHSSRNDTPLSFLMRAIRLPTPAAEWKAPPPTRPAALA